MGHGNEIGIIPRFCEELFSRADVARDLNKVFTVPNVFLLFPKMMQKKNEQIWRKKARILG